jgi:hypothetical protein
MPKLLELSGGKAKCHACAEAWLAAAIREDEVRQQKPE